MTLTAAPLVAGLAVNARRPATGLRVARMMRLASTVLRVAVVVVVLAANSHRVIGIAASGAPLAAIAFIVCPFVAGAALGGRDPARKRVVAVATAQRNLSAAHAVAVHSFSDPAVVVMLTMVLLLDLILLIPGSLLLGRAVPLIAPGRHDAGTERRAVRESRV